MLQRPPIKDELIIACLEDDYKLEVKELHFLPLGADLDTAVYRALTNDKPYFIKLRHSKFNQASVTIPKALADLGMTSIISALNTHSGSLWSSLKAYTLTVYPFIKGHNGFDIKLSDKHRRELGQALKNLHDVNLPDTLSQAIKRETFSSTWRDALRQNLMKEKPDYINRQAKELASFLNTKRSEILALIKRAEQLATILKAQSLDFVLCHADIHGWNLLIDENNALYIVDWDTLSYAPKERDLMFVGSGLGGKGHSLKEETELFYEGYGQTKINTNAIAYYRYERIIEDIAIYCQQVFSLETGTADRQKAVEHVKANFKPNGTIDIAQQADNALLAS